MGKGIETINGQADGSNGGEAAAVAVTDTITTGAADTTTATSSAAGTGTGTTGSEEKRKHSRKNRAIPAVIVPTESVPQPPASAEKPRKAKAVKTDPTIVAALVAVAGTGMTITGKLLGDEKTWTPVGNELVQVAEPAARIIERFAQTETVSKYADYVALGMAVAGIIIPRVLLTMNKPTGVKNNGKKNRSRAAVTNAETTTVHDPVREAGKETSKTDSTDAASNGLKSAVYLGD